MSLSENVAFLQRQKANRLLQEQLDVAKGEKAGPKGPPPVDQRPFWFGLLLLLILVIIAL